MVRELDLFAWKEGDSPDNWQRSRYSGVAMYPDQMVVTIVVILSKNEPAGHAYIIFEWYASEVNEPREYQRKHELYHLVGEATDEERQRGIENPDSSILLSWKGRLGKVLMETNIHYFPRRNKNAYYRSWQVAFQNGWKAREQAFTALSTLPMFNMLEIGDNKNCARWVLDIAKEAGIPPIPSLSKLVAIPFLLKSDVIVEEEAVMWERRRRS